MADLARSAAYTESIPAMVRIGDFLADRLYALGVRHAFTGPAAPPTLAATLDGAGIDVVRMADDEAGAAADAYGRMRGIGVALAGYGASGLALINAAAQAYAERSPLLIIAEMPDRAEWRFHPLLGPAAFNPAALPPQRRAFEPVVASAITLDAPDIACREIEQGLVLMTARKQPVYLEVTAGTLSVTTTPMPAPLAARPISDPAVLAAAITDATAMVRAAAHPVILIGVEIQRFNLQNTVLRFMASSGIPAATTLLGKSVIGEHVPGFMGMYAPDEDHAGVRRLVEESDGLLLLGARGMDLSPGGDPPPIDPGRRLIATADRIQVSHRRYDGITLTDFVNGLAAVDLEPRALSTMPGARVPALVMPNDESALTRDGVYATLAEALTDEMVIVADAGAALLAVADLPVQLCSEFMSPASYGGRGFAIPGSIGVGLAEPELRTVVLVEVAALARNGWELSTARRLGLAPIVIALGDDQPATADWDPRHLTDLIGGGWSVSCRTVGEFANAVATAATRRNDVALIHARLAAG